MRSRKTSPKNVLLILTFLDQQWHVKSTYSRKRNLYLRQGGVPHILSKCCSNDSCGAVRARSERLGKPSGPAVWQCWHQSLADASTCRCSPGVQLGTVGPGETAKGPRRAPPAGRGSHPASTGPGGSTSDPWLPKTSCYPSALSSSGAGGSFEARLQV